MTEQKKAKTPKRNKVGLGAWVRPETKSKLQELSEQTGIDQSTIVQDIFDSIWPDTK